MKTIPIFLIIALLTPCLFCNAQTDITASTTNGISWKIHEDGLAIGIQLVKEPNIGESPLLSVLIENRETNSIHDLIQAKHRFVLGLNGKYYATYDHGGKHSGLDSCCRRFDPIEVTTSDYFEIQKFSQEYGRIENVNHPTIQAGTNTMVLYYKTGSWSNIVYRTSGELILKK